MPLPPRSGGQMHVTDFNLIPKDDTKNYVAGGNVSWVNPYWAPQNVPLINAAVTGLMCGKFREPRPLDVTVVVNRNSDPSCERHRLQSLLRRISPEEEHIAYILATFRDVQNGTNVDDSWQCEVTVNDI